MSCWILQDVVPALTDVVPPLTDVMPSLLRQLVALTKERQQVVFQIGGGARAPYRLPQSA